LDQLATKPGTEIPDTVVTAIERSTGFILVGSPNALGSPHVAREAEVFLARPHQAERPRNIIAIDVGGTLGKDETWRGRIPGLRTEPESGDAVERGRPSREVLRRIFDSA